MNFKLRMTCLVFSSYVLKIRKISLVCTYHPQVHLSVCVCACVCVGLGGGGVGSLKGLGQPLNV